MESTISASWTGERVDSTLGHADGESGSGLVILTDRRVIGLSGGSKKRQTSFASIDDVSGVDLSFEQEGHGSLIWAALGFAVAVLLYFAIDHSMGRLAAPAAVIAMSVYLVVDRLSMPGRRVLAFRTSGSEVRSELTDKLDGSEVYAFINRMYELRDGPAAVSHARGSTFAPR